MAQNSVIPSPDWTRRRLMASLGAAFAAGAVLPADSATAQQDSATASTNVAPARLDQFITLSRTLCGGGQFDSGMASQLLGWIEADPVLSRGLDALLSSPNPSLTPSAATETATPAADPASAAAEAILIFWYVGYFNGKPIPDRSAAYTQLIAWQAMYTAPFAVCKEFGGWADPPNTEPVVLGI